MPRGKCLLPSERRVSKRRKSRRPRDIGDWKRNETNRLGESKGGGWIYVTAIPLPAIWRFNLKAIPRRWSSNSQAGHRLPTAKRDFYLSERANAPSLPPWSRVLVPTASCLWKNPRLTLCTSLSFSRCFSIDSRLYRVHRSIVVLVWISVTDLKFFDCGCDEG